MLPTIPAPTPSKAPLAIRESMQLSPKVRFDTGNAARMFFSEKGNDRLMRLTDPDRNLIKGKQQDNADG